MSVFGLALLLWLIPAHTETVDYGWIRPDTLPRACAWGLLMLGLVQAAVPRGAVALDRSQMRITVLGADHAVDITGC